MDPSPNNWGQAGKQSESTSLIAVSKKGNCQNLGV